MIQHPGLPRRYVKPWRAPFDERVAAALKPGISVLDIGGGRRPTVPASLRPAGMYYVGLDLSADELAAAPCGSYDETWASDVTLPVPELDGRFDLVISFQVLEHVRPLGEAFENMRTYLKPGGRLICQFSGAFSFFALASRVMPRGLVRWALISLLHRDSANIFPAEYHRTYVRELRKILRPWTGAEIVPRFVGATYLAFFRPAQLAYLVFENWAVRARHDNLATHYIVDARR